MKHQRLATVFALLLAACSASPNDRPSGECDGGSCPPTCDGAVCPPACDLESCSPTCDAGCASSCDGGDCPKCAADEDCGSAERCLEQRCVPLNECELGCKAGMVCEPDSGRCVGCLGHADCQSTEYCETASDYACTDDVCASGSARCVGNTVEFCAATGAAWGESIPCGTDSTCKALDGQAWCAPSQCETGEVRCAGQRLMTCAADGGSWELLEDCGVENAACSTDSGVAACTPLSCTPGTRQCGADGSVLECDPAGIGFFTLQACEATSPCRWDTLRCTDLVCTPRAHVCDGNASYTCNSDGTDYNSVRVCAGDEVCNYSGCRKVVCAADAYFCSGNNIIQCSADGTQMTQVRSCTNQYCVDGESTCRSKLCTANAQICDGTRRVQCNADGTGYVEASAVDCSATGQLCQGGSCVARTCDPLAYSCIGGDVHRCNILGTTTYVQDQCGAGESCQDGYRSCLSQVCPPNQAACLGQAAVVCDSAGAGYVDAGTDCAAQGQSCSAGQCVDRVCTPNQLACVAGNVVRCAADGLSQPLRDTCTAQEYCSPSSPVCLKKVCAAGSTGCAGTKIGTCDAQGSGYTAGSVDCADAPGMTCVAGQCVAQVCDPTQPLHCDYSTLFRCNEFGSARTTVEYCGRWTTCVASPGYCAPTVCRAGEGACDGQRATTCNADGSAFLPGGTDCATQYCVGGVCADQLFYEGFEDGDVSDWFTDGGWFSLNASAAAADTSLGMQLDYYYSHYATHELPFLQPSSVSWWQYSDYEINLTVSLEVVTVYTSGPIYVNGAAVGNPSPNAWHQVELRNIDWGRRALDVYVDGQVRTIGLAFQGNATGFPAIQLQGQGRIDEIEFR